MAVAVVPDNDNGAIVVDVDVFTFFFLAFPAPGAAEEDVVFVLDVVVDVADFD